MYSSEREVGGRGKVAKLTVKEDKTEFSYFVALIWQVMHRCSNLEIVNRSGSIGCRHKNSNNNLFLVFANECHSQKN